MLSRELSEPVRTEGALLLSSEFSRGFLNDMCGMITFYSLFPIRGTPGFPVSNAPTCGSSYPAVSCIAGSSPPESVPAPDSPGPGFLSKPYAPEPRQTFQNLGFLTGHNSYVACSHPHSVPHNLVSKTYGDKSRPCSEPSGTSRWWQQVLGWRVAPCSHRVSPGSCQPATCENSWGKPP